jgi:hypothetical protein
MPNLFRFVVSIILTLSLLAILIWLPMRFAEPVFIVVWVICVILCFYIGFLLRNTTATTFFLALGGIMGALAMSEAFLFALSVYGPNRDDKRVLIYDRFPLRLEDDGAVLYPADTEFTEILSRGNEIGYVKSYRINNFGLRDEVDYPLNSKRHIVFVGDSFTASQGSSFSWVSKLSRELEKKGVSIYNLGVFGTGLIHFEKILRHFKDKISFDEIVLVTISNDFMRPYWFPQQEDNRVLFCRKDTTQPCKGIGVVDSSYARELSEKRSVGLELNELEVPLQRHQI